MFLRGMCTCVCSADMAKREQVLVVSTIPLEEFDIDVVLKKKKALHACALAFLEAISALLVLRGQTIFWRRPLLPKPRKPSRLLPPGPPGLAGIVLSPPTRPCRLRCRHCRHCGVLHRPNGEGQP